MATHRLPVFSFAARPDDSGRVYLEPLDVSGSNDQWDHFVWVLEDSGTKIGIHGSVEVPQNYVGTAVLVVVWTTPATSGDVVFDFDYRAVGGNDTESLDQAGTQEAVTVTDTAPSAAFERMEAEIALTSANLAAGDTLQFLLSRDGAQAADTLAADCLIVGAYLKYADA
jgi:hypothetical protein